MPSLEIRSGKNAGQRYNLSKRETIIGRHPGCHVVLRESHISRQHARILHDADGHFLEDLNSQNGTFLNGCRVEGRQRLSDQDQIEFKDIALLFHSDEPQAALAAKRLRDDSAQVLADDEGSLEHSSTILTELELYTAAVAERSEANAEMKLRAVLEITSSLGSTLEFSEIIARILDSLFRIFPQADRGYVLLADGPGDSLVLRAIQQRDNSVPGRPSGRPISQTIARRVMAEQKAILSADAAQDQRFKGSDSVVDLGIRSVMCAPLMGPDRQPLGIIQLDSMDIGRRFSVDDLDVLANVAALAGQAVENAKAHEMRRQLDRREQELATAKDVQMQLLPQTPPDVPEYQFFDYYLAADGVGGDYYGYIELPDGRLAIALGDVAGHGVSAALLMAELCSEVRYCLVTSSTPAEAIGSLNQHLCKRSRDGRFITFAMSILNPTTHELVVVNAGHMPPLLRRASSSAVEPIGADTSGTPLGLDPNCNYGQTAVTIEPGDAVVVYTDGITESVNAKRKLYGKDRISSLIAKTLPDATRIGEAILADVRKFVGGKVQNDDVCLLCFVRNPAEPAQRDSSGTNGRSVLPV